MLAYVLTLGRLLLAAGFAAGVACWKGPAALGTVGVTALLALAVAEELTDIFDGVTARRAGTASPLGGILDPLADSLARLTIYFAMALAGWVTLAVPLTMTARDILVAYARIANAAAGLSTSARLSGKVKAIFQGAGILAILLLAAAATKEAIGADLAKRLRVAVAAVLIAVTAWSMVDYVRSASPAIRRMRNP